MSVTTGGLAAGPAGPGGEPHRRADGCASLYPAMPGESYR